MISATPKVAARRAVEAVPHIRPMTLRDLTERKKINAGACPANFDGRLR